MKAIVWTGTGLEVRDDVTVRAPEPGEVVVRVTAAGLCHSDLNPIRGTYPQRVPAVLGHEAVGRVVAAGDQDTALLGARVVLSSVRSCGRCRSCGLGRPTTCTAPPPPRTTPLSTPAGPLEQFVQLGAWAQHVLVNTGQVVPVPEGIPDASAALLGCAVVTGAGAVERAAVRAGDTVVVTGAGGIGLNAIQAARWTGASQILVCDRNPAKEAIATQLGATHFAVTPTAAGVVAAARSLGPVDAAIECVGRVDVLEAVISVLGPGGRAVIVGLPGQSDAMTVPVRSLYQDKAVLGCRMGSVHPHEAIPRLAARYVAGELQLDPLVSRVVEPEEIDELVADLDAGRLDRGVIRF